MTRRMAALGLGVVLTSGAALACGNAMYLATDRASRMIADAEAALENNQAHKALTLLPSRRYRIGGANHQLDDPFDTYEQHAEKLKQRAPLFDPQTVQRRLDFVQAVAWMRTGQVGRAQTYFTNHPAVADDKPEMKARRAEAFSFDKERTEEAVKLLDDLVAADLMPDAFAWRTLADLRLRARDVAGHKEALKQCAAATKIKSICDGKGKSRI